MREIGIIFIIAGVLVLLITVLVMIAILHGFAIAFLVLAFILWLTGVLIYYMSD